MQLSSNSEIMIGGGCRTHGRGEKRIHVCGWQTEGKGLLGRPGSLLELVVGSRIKEVAGFCETDNQLLSISCLANPHHALHPM